MRFSRFIVGEKRGLPYFFEAARKKFPRAGSPKKIVCKGGWCNDEATLENL